MGSLEDKLPDVMGKQIPDFTGPSIQLTEPNKVNKFGNPKNWNTTNKNKRDIYSKARTWDQIPTTLDIIDKPRLEYPVVDYPTFKALDYLPDKFIRANPVKQPNQQQPKLPEPPEFKPIVKKDKEFFIKCPSEDNLQQDILALVCQ